MKKGMTFPEDLGMTLVLLLVFVALVLIAFLIYVKMNVDLFSENSVSYSADFASLASKPYMIADVMMRTKMDDRQFLEQAIEAVAVNSLEKSKAERLPDRVRSLMSAFDLRYFKITLKREDELMNVESTVQRCGQNSVGWCNSRFNGCDVGRVQIDAYGKCAPSDICCKADIDAYNQQEEEKLPERRTAVVTCSNREGVCSVGEQFEPPYYFTFKCSPGQTYLGEPTECRNANSGKTPVCCAEGVSEEEAPGITNSAVVPLLYKDKVGYAEVEAK